MTRHREWVGDVVRRIGERARPVVDRLRVGQQCGAALRGEAHRVAGRAADRNGRSRAPTARDRGGGDRGRDANESRKSKQKPAIHQIAFLRPGCATRKAASVRRPLNIEARNRICHPPSWLGSVRGTAAKPGRADRRFRSETGQAAGARRRTARAQRPQRDRRRRAGRRAAPFARQAAGTGADRPARRPWDGVPRAECPRSVGGVRRPGARAPGSSPGSASSRAANA